MNVYVVGFGERGEGYEAEAVFRSLAGAREYVLKKWDVCVVLVRWGQWIGRLNGCDEVTITRLPLRGAA